MSLWGTAGTAHEMKKAAFKAAFLFATSLAVASVERTEKLQ